MKKIFSFLSAILISLFSLGQAAIEGTVIGKDNLAISSATVSLLDGKDSSLLKISVTDKDGKYSIPYDSPGEFLVMASFVNYQPAYSDRLVFTGKNLNLAPLKMIEEPSELAAVTLVKKKPLVEQKIDRMVVNVEASLTNTGSSALEVLEKSPGIQVDKDGNISIKGKQGVTVLVDGRPTYLSGAELAAMLSGMEASQLEQIEIMTNPPAKYEAAGSSGLINIKTKKNRRKGFNGNIGLGYTQGIYGRRNASFGLNYMHNKINLFTNYGYGYRDRFHQLLIHREYLEIDKSVRAIFDQRSVQRADIHNHNLKLGMDYHISKKTAIGIVGSGYIVPEDYFGHNTSYLKNAANQLDSIVYSQQTAKELWKNGSLNLNLRHNFDSTGREFTADIDYIRYKTLNNTDFLNTIRNPEGENRYDELLRGDLPMAISILSASVDYVHPISKGKLEAGLKSSKVSTVNRAYYYELEAERWETDFKRTNSFDYDESIQAAYLNMSRELNEKWSVQTGLRYEYTSYTGRQFGNPTKTDSSFTRNYGSLFPTVYLSYKPAEDHQFGLSAGRRINRPRYQDMNPFLFFIDKYTYSQGNPWLIPQFSNNLELSHTFKGRFTTTLNYSVTKNLFTEVFDQPDSQNGYDYSTVVKRGNIGRVQNAGVAVSAQLSAGKWLNSSLYGNYSYNHFEGVLDGEALNAGGGLFSFNVNNQIRFNQNWSAELSGWYRTAGLDAQVTIRNMGQLHLGVARQILKSKGSVKISLRDILNSQQARGSMRFKSTNASFQNIPDSRSISINFSYRFGQPLKPSGPRKKDRNLEEQNRAGN